MRQPLTLFLLLLVLITGCTHSHTFQLAEYHRDLSHKYPPVSITVNDSYVGLYLRNCNSTCSFSRDNIDYNILFALREPGIFKRVDINNAYSEYVFDIKFYKPDKDKTTHFDVAIRYKNDIVKQYQYRAEVRRNLFGDTNIINKNAIEYFVSLFLFDIQHDGTFTNSAIN